MKAKLILIAALTIITIFSMSVSADNIPHTMNYQGMLTDPAGDPVADGPSLVKFIIYDAAATGDYWRDFSAIKVTSVSAGTHKFYLNGSRGSGGTGDIGRRHLTVTFYPTAYGTVVSTAPPIGGSNQGLLSTNGSDLPDPELIDLRDEVNRLKAIVEEQNKQIMEQLREENPQNQETEQQ